MEITLIDHTHNAMDKLLYTKATRLTQGATTRAMIAAMSPEEKAEELQYMANTIPSSWEFVDYTFEICGVTRAFTHQFVRTRHGSYAQQTMRMLPMENFEFLIPEKIVRDEDAVQDYIGCMGLIQKTYDDLLEAGILPEDARGVLPTNIKTNIIAQFNLRTLSEMARARTGLRTQSEYRDVLDKMLACVMEVHPWAEDFLFPKGKVAFANIEYALARAHAVGAITTTQFTDCLKDIDAVKKG